MASACSYCRFQCAMRRKDRSVGSPSRQSVEHVRQARRVRITRWGFAIWLDPFRMLDPQIAVNLLLEFGVRVSCLANPRLRRKPTNLWRPLSALFREILRGEGLRARA